MSCKIRFVSRLSLCPFTGFQTPANSHKGVQGYQRRAYRPDNYPQNKLIDLRRIRIGKVPISAGCLRANCRERTDAHAKPRREKQKEQHYGSEDIRPDKPDPIPPPFHLMRHLVLPVKKKVPSPELPLRLAKEPDRVHPTPSQVVVHDEDLHEPSDNELSKQRETAICSERVRETEQMYAGSLVVICS